MSISRRKFISLSSLASASVCMPKFLKAYAQHQVASNHKVLVIIQLSGGNDGLNTIIPVRNDIYYKMRPQIGISKEDAITLNDDAAIHPALKSFADLYQQGHLAVLNNVGYPNPDRSHFRSMDIWHTASASNEIKQYGWLGKYLDAQCAGCDKPTIALEIDDVLSLALKGEHYKGIAFKDLERLYRNSKNNFLLQLQQTHAYTSHEEKPIDYLYKTITETTHSAQYIYDNYQRFKTKYSYPDSDLGRNLKTIASLILSDINTTVYYVSVSGFDTHVHQAEQQTKLFTELSNAVDAFVKDLKQNNRFKDVLLCTFSEFGRRVSENASKGTDHGTANNMFFISESLKEKGILNALPNLSNLDDGDLKYTVDFKQVYATLLDKWLNQNHQSILNHQYDLLSFV